MHGTEIDCLEETGNLCTLSDQIKEMSALWGTRVVQVII